MVCCPIFRFEPRLSSIIRVWRALQGEELGPFTDIMGDVCNTVDSQRWSRKFGPVVKGDQLMREIIQTEPPATKPDH